MLGLNMLYLQDNNKSISKNDIGQKFIKITTANFEYDGEYFLDIMGKYIDKSESKNCIFEVNELIWQYLLDKTDTFKSKQFEEVLYDFSDEDDLQEAIEIYYAAFPTLSSLRRIIPRIPDGSVQAAANAKVIKHIKIHSNHPHPSINEETEQYVKIGKRKKVIINSINNDRKKYFLSLSFTNIIFFSQGQSLTCGFIKDIFLKITVKK
jgi:hypothetical protein